MNSNNQKILLVVLAVLIVGSIGVYAVSRNNSTLENNPTQSEGVNNDIAVGEPNPNGNRVTPPSTTQDQTPGKLKVANFTGKLQEVNTGCFADGECYIVVAGKHVTVLTGWSKEVVGSIQGVESVGDLESLIGRDVEVYAQDKGDGTYTLYGNAGFYAKLVK
jgi:hypothetical protein